MTWGWWERTQLYVRAVEGDSPLRGDCRRGLNFTWGLTFTWGLRQVHVVTVGAVGGGGPAFVAVFPTSTT